MENFFAKHQCHIRETLQIPALAFIESLKDVNYTASTVKSYIESVRRFCLFLAGENIDRFQDVDVKVIEKYRLLMFSSHLAESSIDHFLRGAKALFMYLEKQGEIFENPFHHIEMHRPERKLLGVLSEKEIKKLLSAPDCSTATGLRDRAMLEILYATGIRRFELLKLTIFDVDIDRQTLRVVGKGRRERVLPIGKHAAKYVGLYLKHGRSKLISRAEPDATWLFLSGKPKSKNKYRPNTDTYFFAKYAEESGITKPVSCHTLRRSCATHMLKHGAHPLMVAEMLGHSSLRNLSQYLQVSITELIKSHGQCKVGK